MTRPRPLRARRPTETRRLALLLMLGALIPTVSGCPFGGRDDVLVLARRGDTTSLAIAEHYAERAGLASDRILELTLTIPLGEGTIDAETYRVEIAEAIERHLILSDSADDVIRLVTTRGLPLEVEDCRDEAIGCQRAALDAALAQLGRVSEGRAFERVANPYFRSPEPFEDHLDAHDEGPLRFLVTRLTASHAEGQSTTDVPRALADALDRAPRPEEAEAPMWHVAPPAAGGRPLPAGRLLLDPIAARLPNYGHRVCNGCDAATATGLILAREGPVERLPRLESTGLIVSLLGHSAQERKGRPSAFTRIVDRWLARGATGLSLHLEDPFLAEVLRPDALLEAWARGLTAAEAHFASLPLLGGRHVFVGDGLRALPSVALPAALDDDRDGDGIADASDNCPMDPNPDQRDTNEDGFGNLCDADVDDDGDVDTSWGRIYPVDARGDLEAVTLTARNGPYDPDHDLDGDGRVDEHDLLRVQLALSRPPGR